jgi:hypothetical protein
MRTETRQHNVYKFDELKKETQEKVINRFREQNEIEFLEESLTDYMFQLLEEHNLKPLNDDAKLYYSLTYCQGDGVCFVGRFNSPLNYLIVINHKGNYYHKRSVEISIMDETGEELQDEKVFNIFKNLYEEICDKIEKQGYAIIENENSEETIKENIELNDYEFLENGEVYK